jgi:hypothetical protein
MQCFVKSVILFIFVRVYDERTGALKLEGQKEQDNISKRIRRKTKLQCIV